jgi:hypothetical protein
MELIKTIQEKNWDGLKTYCTDKIHAIVETMIDTRKNEYLEKIQADHTAQHAE